MNRRRWFTAAVLAAGRGTRMQTSTPKVLLDLNGRPIIHHVLSTLQCTRVLEVIVVVGYRASMVRRAIQQVECLEGIRLAIQENQLGTGDALRVVSKNLRDPTTDLLVLNGDDSALYSAASLERLMTLHATRPSVVTVLFSRVEPSCTLGRVCIGKEGGIEFVSYGDMLKRGLDSSLVSTGTYVFDREWLEANVLSIPKHPDGEYPNYELVYVAQRQGHRVDSMILEDANEWMSINTPSDLQKARRLRSPKNARCP